MGPMLYLPYVRTTTYLRRKNCTNTKSNNIKKHKDSVIILYAIEMDQIGFDK